jgi:hypothetical protein
MSRIDRISRIVDVEVVSHACIAAGRSVSGERKARSGQVVLDTDIHCFRVRATETL